ncbi:MAG: hypothetical protein WC861_02305 [Candidatus Micrarchaeia archaeon]|jgi:hypothetical protein
MKTKKLVEHKKQECACDVIISKQLEIVEFGNGAHIIVPKFFMKEYSRTVVVGLWKKSKT